MVAALSAVLGFAAVYGTLGRPDNGDDVRRTRPAAAKVPDEVNKSVSAGSGTKGLSTGAMTTFVFKKTPEELPEIAFVDAGGAAKIAQGLPRQDRALEPLGDLVRPLPRGDAGARPASEELGSD